MKRRHLARASRRRRWLRRSDVWRTAPPPSPDPLHRPHARLRLVPWLIGAALVHVFAISSASIAMVKKRSDRSAPFEVTRVPEVKTPAKEEAPKPAAEETTEPKRPKPAPPRKAEPKRAPEPKPEPEPELEPKVEPPPRRIVGMNLSSTVRGGDGPAFAVGDTREGVTESRARDPDDHPPPPTAEEKPRAISPARLRVARGEGGELSLPKRLVHLEPEYPETYRRQGIEGRVTVALTIGADGSVRQIELVGPSPHDEFNRAARETAQRERFSPAQLDGAPIEYSVRFTYHFRLST